MTSEQKAIFEGYAIMHACPESDFWEGLKGAWEACLAYNFSLKEGYQIGEKVEYTSNRGHIGWLKAQVSLTDLPTGIKIADAAIHEVHKLPAWEPKEGEAILVSYAGYAQPAVYSKKIVLFGKEKFMPFPSQMKPFDSSTIGQ